MATRLNTVEYPFTLDTTSLAAATRFDFAAETIYIPEITSRSFVSVFVEVSWSQNNTAATSLTSFLIGIKLGATAFNDATVTQTFTNSGEINSWIVKRDVTSYFTTNFGSGASQTCQVGVQFGATSQINITAKLVVTYSYDDTDNTRVKTVRIPIESQTGALTTSSTQLGTSQIPALTGGSGILPEASITIRQIWFECEMADNGAGTTDWQHELKLDSGGTAELDGLHEAFDSASHYYKRIWRPTISDTTVSHGIYVRTTNATSGKCSHQAITMYVTYEYDHSSSSTIFNSVLLPFGGQYGANAASGDKHRFSIEYYLPEPATVTLQQSGVFLTFCATAGEGISVAVGGQTARTYTHGNATTEQSGFYVAHRFDSGGAQGSGHTLVRGLNTLIVDVYATGATLRAADGFILLNYTSGKASGGAQTHNKTIRVLVAANTTAVTAPTGSVSLSIPETSYFINRWGMVFDLQSTAATIAREYFEARVELASTELKGAGWIQVYSQGLATDSEMLTGIRFIGDAPESVLRYPGDPRDGFDVETSRTWAATCASASMSVELVVTYHSVTFTKSGTVSAYQDADGAGLTVEYYKVSNKEFVGTSTTTTGGAHSFTWYDDVDPLFAVLRENSSHCGASWEG